LLIALTQSADNRQNKSGNNLQVYHPVGRDDKPQFLASDCCIMANSGALCRIQVKRGCWRQTDKQTSHALPTMGAALSSPLDIRFRGEATWNLDFHKRYGN